MNVMLISQLNKRAMFIHVIAYNDIKFRKMKLDFTTSKGTARYRSRLVNVLFTNRERYLWYFIFCAYENNKSRTNVTKNNLFMSLYNIILINIERYWHFFYESAPRKISTERCLFSVRELTLDIRTEYKICFQYWEK